MSTELAVHTPVKASDQLAAFLGIEKGMMLETLKAQCFKNKRPDEVSDAQLAAFVSTANVLQVNPLVPGMLYAYPERNGGITPILGPDGVFKKLDEFIASGKLSGFECEVFMGADGKPERAEATIHRMEGQKPAKYTAYFSEWSVTSNPNWAARPRHMLWVRAIKQAARQVIHGLPMDADEYEISRMSNVTGSADDAPMPPRPEPKPRSPKGAAAVKHNEAKIVDAVVTPVEESPAEKPAAPVEPAPDKPATTAKVESFADAAAAAAAEPAKAPEPASAPKATPAPKAPESITQKAMLADGEAIEVEAMVDEVKTVVGKRDGKDYPYVTAIVVSPQFRGQVAHTDGGIADGQPVAAWQLDNPVRLKLRGKRYKSGTLVTIVESITEASAAGQQAAGDDV